VAPLAIIGPIAAAFALTGCSDSAGAGPFGAKPFDAMSGEEHLACAVDISAYTYLIAAGTLPENRESAGQSGLAAAWHHNAYAIPLSKGEQYDLINQKRAALMAKDAPQAIEARAIACIRQRLPRPRRSKLPAQQASAVSTFS
jgi:hypothetical protein